MSAPTLSAKSASDPSLAYATIIDAGSGGSRIFIYQWVVHNKTPNLKYLRKVFGPEEIKDGMYLTSVPKFPLIYHHRDSYHERTG